MTPSESEIRAIVGQVLSRIQAETEQPLSIMDAPTTPAPFIPANDSPPPEKTVAIAADHGGYGLKEALKTFLEDLGFRVIDLGTHSTDSVDYPDYAYAVAAQVAQKRCAVGIVIDGAGIGSCMAANKVPGIRASLCYDVSSAANAREHNFANVLTLGAGLVGVNLAKQIVKTWLETPWGGDRHARRVDKISAIEQRYSKMRDSSGHLELLSGSTGRNRHT
ncbi:MAG: ribose 5-phosphate isomerase B [Caldilineales bacterium]|nr:ribose 5-phosphate isomerase B [Caldilineales bacterium]